MSELEPWKVALIVVASTLAALFLLWLLVVEWYAPRSYKRMVSKNAVSVDAFVGQPDGPTATSCLKCILLSWFNVGNRTISRTAIELKAVESDDVPGLKKTYRRDSGASLAESNADKPPPLVVGTIRMGFGHHRIAYAATSWGIDNPSNKSDTYFHDLLNVDSEEANMIRDTDKMYSKGSRLASEMGGVVEKFWGSLTKSGDEDSLRVTYQFAEHMRPIIDGLDKRSPIIASHCMVAAAAVAAGFKNVINLVIDNHAQWFCVVPGALNLVQGPSNYHSFLRMGVSPDELQLAGHWIPRDLVEGIPDACARRTRRAQSNPRKPLRIIIPVGGAGAQRKFVTSLVRALAPLAREGKVQLFLNAGDHSHMKEAFGTVLREEKLDYDIVPDMKGVLAFREKLLSKPDSAEPDRNVTLFAFDDYFPGVTTTDILCSVADVLACKPSELAFYPIPKLMIRRVGDHEAYSALRASELGDGTLEARQVEDALAYVELFLRPELLVAMNASIVNNNKNGVYDGCKNAVRIALERAESMGNE